MGVVFREGGLALAIVVIVLMAAVSHWTMTLIARCLDRVAELVPEDQRNGEAVDWPLIGQVVAGRPGRLIVTIVFVVELFVMATYLQVLGCSTMAVIFPAADKLALVGAGGGATLALL